MNGSTPFTTASLCRGGGPPPGYGGPERRQEPGPDLRWLRASLDQVDYPMLLVASGARLLHANRAAFDELADDGHPLCVHAGRLQESVRRGGGALPSALAAVLQHGQRRPLTLQRSDGRSVSAALVPLAAPAGEDAAAALLILARDRLCPPLAVHWFARSHGLSAAETQVLEALCAGRQPREIALHHGVSLATVRAQIGTMRCKTRSASLRELMRQVAALPPVLGRLGAR